MHELEERMRAQEVGIATLTQSVDDNTQMVGKMLTKIDKTVYGTDANPGLVTRLDREEQKSKNITKIIWIVVTGAVGMGMTYAAKTLF